MKILLVFLGECLASLSQLNTHMLQVENLGCSLEHLPVPLRPASLSRSLSSGTLGLRWMVSTAQTDWFMGVRFACRPPEDPALRWLRSRACLPHPEDSKALPWLRWCQTPNGHFSTTPICHRGRLGSSLKQEEKKEIERAVEEKK